MAAHIDQTGARWPSNWWHSSRLRLAVWIAFTAWLVVRCYRAVGDVFDEQDVWVVPVLDHVTVRWGQLDDAMVRNLAAVSVMAVVMAAVFTIGSALCRVGGLAGRTASESVVIRAAAGFTGLSWLGLGLGLAHLYYDWLLVAVVVAVAGSGVVWAARTGQLRRWRTLAGPMLGSRPRGPWHRCLALVMSAAFAFAFVGALAPEVEYDAVWYHLGHPQAWLRAHRLVDLPADYTSLYPGNWELIFGTGLAFGSPVGAKLAHFAALPLCALATAELARRCHRGIDPMLASTIVVAAPIMLWESTTAYLDLALAFHVSVAILALLHFDDSGERRWILLAAAQLGFAVGIKWLALFVVASVALVMIGTGLRRGQALRRAIRVPAMVAVVSVVLNLPWLIRAWLTTGNPVFPELYGLFGGPKDRWSERSESGLDAFLDTFGRSRSWHDLVTLPWDVTVHSWRYGGTVGPLVLAGVLWALLSRRADSPHRAVWSVALAQIGVGVVIYLALWASPLASFQFRFLVPIVPLLAVLAAFGLTAAMGSTIAQRRIVGGLVVALLVIQLPPFTPLAEDSGWLNHTVHEVPLGVVIGAETPDEFLARTVRSYRGWQWINVNLPHDALVLTSTGGDHLYSDRCRLWTASTIAGVVAYGPESADPARAHSTLEALRSLGVTHVLLDRRDQDVTIAPAALGDGLQLVFEDANTTLHALVLGPSAEQLSAGRRFACPERG